MNLLGASSRRPQRKRKLPRHPATRWLVFGVVKGAGFRVFVYRLAHEYQLTGWVRRYVGGVEIVAAGALHQRQAFARDLVRRAPAMTHPQISHCEPLGGLIMQDFRILDDHVPAAGDKPGRSSTQ
jgi:hydrogenase maturation protein HypF